MKFHEKRCLAVVFIIQALISFAISKKSSAGSKKAWVKPFAANSEGYIAFANLSYCPAEKIKILNCPQCSIITESGFIIFSQYKKKINNNEYTFVILLSTTKNQVVVAFSGPADAKAEFLVSINKSELQNFGNYEGVKIESQFLNVYLGDFVAELEKSLKNYQTMFKANHHDHQYIFVGHQIGGALATLAAYDMIKKEVIFRNDKLISPIVYSYGGLRIGNAEFAKEANKTINTIRINKVSDANTRLPGCKIYKNSDNYICDLNKSHINPQVQQHNKNYSGNKTVQAQFTAAYQNSRVGNRAFSFLEVSKSSKLTKKGKTSRNWAYSLSNPGDIQHNNMSNFDRNGKDYTGFSMIPPLGVEILYSDDFKTNKTCNIRDNSCSKGLNKKVNTSEGNTYFGKIINIC